MLTDEEFRPWCQRNQISPKTKPKFNAFAPLSQHSGVDFLSYKPATLQRRIENRMALTHFADLSAYAAYLHEHPDEVGALAQSVLIEVTDFFRDPTVFEVLTRAVWPTFLSGSAKGKTLRIWVPGCATGEEAYTLAISLLPTRCATR